MRTKMPPTESVPYKRQPITSFSKIKIYQKK